MTMKPSPKRLGLLAHYVDRTGRLAGDQGRRRQMTTCWICYTTATHDSTRGPFADFAAAQAEMRREARWYRARIAYIVAAEDDPLNVPTSDGLEFACDYTDEISD